jgi:hypothetical protein
MQMHMASSPFGRLPTRQELQYGPLAMPPMSGDLASLDGIGDGLDLRTMFVQNVSSRLRLTAHRSPFTVHRSPFTVLDV